MDTSWFACWLWPELCLTLGKSPNFREPPLSQLCPPPRASQSRISDQHFAVCRRLTWQGGNSHPLQWHTASQPARKLGPDQAAWLPIWASVCLTSQPLLCAALSRQPLTLVSLGSRASKHGSVIGLAWPLWLSQGSCLSLLEALGYSGTS